MLVGNIQTLLPSPVNKPVPQWCFLAVLNLTGSNPRWCCSVVTSHAATHRRAPRFPVLGRLAARVWEAPADWLRAITSYKTQALNSRLLPFAAKKGASVSVCFLEYFLSASSKFWEKIWHYLAVLVGGKTLTQDNLNISYSLKLSLLKDKINIYIFYTNIMMFTKHLLINKSIVNHAAISLSFARWQLVSWPLACLSRHVSTLLLILWLAWKL